LIAASVTAGGAQVAAGVGMYLAGVYFARWSIFVSYLVLLICIVSGTWWCVAHRSKDEITYLDALGAGIAISVSTGLIYAIYNLVSISFFYPHFLDEVVQARIAQAAALQQSHESFAALRATVTAPSIAIPNLVRLSVLGAFLSVWTSFFFRRRRQSADPCHR